MEKSHTTKPRRTFHLDAPTARNLSDAAEWARDNPSAASPQLVRAIAKALLGLIEDNERLQRTVKRHCGDDGWFEKAVSGR